MTYATDRLFEEVAYVAYHFHWSKEEIFSMPHRERHQWVEEISKINKKINKQQQSASSAPSGGSCR